MGLLCVFNLAFGCQIFSAAARPQNPGLPVERGAVGHAGLVTEAAVMETSLDVATGSFNCVHKCFCLCQARVYFHVRCQPFY